MILLTLLKNSPGEPLVVIEGKTWNIPAIAGGKLLVRNANEMAAYNIAAN